MVWVICGAQEEEGCRVERVNIIMHGPEIRLGWGRVSQPKRIVRSGSMKNKGGNANSTKMSNIRGKR